MVIGFWLWRHKLPVLFIIPAMLFMLVIPAVAMAIEIPRWLGEDNPNWIVIFIASATMALEVWMIVEASLLWPKARGQLEAALPSITQKANTTADGGRSC